MTIEPFWQMMLIGYFSDFQKEFANSSICLQLQVTVKNRPKWLYRLSCPETNMFATSVKSKSSVISLCDVNIANELNLFLFHGGS